MVDKKPFLPELIHTYWFYLLTFCCFYPFPTCLPADRLFQYSLISAIYSWHTNAKVFISFCARTSGVASTVYKSSFSQIPSSLHCMPVFDVTAKLITYSTEINKTPAQSQCTLLTHVSWPCRPPMYHESVSYILSFVKMQLTRCWLLDMQRIILSWLSVTSLVTIIIIINCLKQ
jgi:hypothetical protein